MTDMLTITDIVGYNSKLNATVSGITSKLTAGEIDVVQAASQIEAVTGARVKPIYSVGGSHILGWGVDETATVATTNAINSNASTIARGSLNAPVTTTATQAGKLSSTRLAGIGSKAMTIGSKLALPVTMAAIGCTLGKTIDEIAYNANPDFWEDMGAWSVNPQTWSTIAGGDGTFGGSFINAVFGIDPQTGESQAYIDANAMSYLAYVMQLAGFFSAGGYVPESYSDLHHPEYLNFPISVTESTEFNLVYRQSGAISRLLVQTQTSPVYGVVPIYNNTPSSWCLFFSLQPFSGRTSINVSDRNFSSESIVLKNGQRVHYFTSSTNINSYEIQFATTPTNTSSTNRQFVEKDIITTVLFGDEQSTNPGIGTQPGSTVPNFDGLSEGDYLPYLQQTYPDMFNNAITYPVVQPDGTIQNYTYVPITLPETPNVTDTQPTTGNQTQTNPAIDPSIAPADLVELLTKLLQQPETETPTDDITPPENPTDIGDGSTPPLVVPVGSASALWKIYHPTQAEVDSFGGWLWSSNFIDQILKIFNNPMEAVIGLHKVYATPIDAGTTTIKVGYLDSQVSSAYIEQQYIDVDCGSVNLNEEFGNALDYTGTSVKLYLPFVGIVSLDVDEVMRSEISISYGVDVITGACLARVSVARDGFDSVLYQYAGNCAVQYPISSGSYMGIVSSIIGVAGSFAATVASGGSVAPLAFGAMGATFGAHTTVQNSGSFSGNAGAMGGKIPYLIIERAQSAIADNFESFEGIPANQKTTIGECSGFVKAKVSHVNVEATDTEIDEIISLLAEGIIV